MKASTTFALLITYLAGSALAMPVSNSPDLTPRFDDLEAASFDLDKRHDEVAGDLDNHHADEANIEARDPMFNRIDREASNSPRAVKPRATKPLGVAKPPNMFGNLFSSSQSAPKQPGTDTNKKGVMPTKDNTKLTDKLRNLALPKTNGPTKARKEADRLLQKVEETSTEPDNLQKKANKLDDDAKKLDADAKVLLAKAGNIRKEGGKIQQQADIAYEKANKAQTNPPTGLRKFLQKGQTPEKLRDTADQLQKQANDKKVQANVRQNEADNKEKEARVLKNEAQKVKKEEGVIREKMKTLITQANAANRKANEKDKKKADQKKAD